MSKRRNRVLTIARVSNSEFEQHLIFKCPICDYELPSYHALRMHLKRKHQELTKKEITEITKPVRNLERCFARGVLVI